MPARSAGAIEAVRRRNRTQLHAFAASSDPQQRLVLRNSLVAANLGLVVGQARNLGHSHRLDADDLTQVGSLGLIRAVEAYDPARGTALSTFALPYIRGAILHELRDRRHLVRVPRDLWELRQRVNRLQDQQRRSGGRPLAPEQLALQLGCAPERLRDLEQLPLLEAPCSLDAPAPGRSGGGGDAASLIDLLPAQAPAPAGADAPAGDSAELQWLRSQLQGLAPGERELLLGRLHLGCSWVELGRRLGLAPRQAQRRCCGLLRRLQAAAERWRRDQLAGSNSGITGSSSG